jgi:hypothetical protein
LACVDGARLRRKVRGDADWPFEKPPDLESGLNPSPGLNKMGGEGFNPQSLFLFRLQQEYQFHRT